MSRERHKFGGGSHSFVKTARKPYDAVVATILAAAQKIAPKKFNPGGDGGLKGVRPGGMGKWKWLPDKVEEQQLTEKNEKQKIIKYLIKKGSNPRDAKKDADKHYDYVSKKYKDAPIAKKAEVIVSLHERTLTEKQEADSHMVKAVADLTDVNDHNQARYMASRYTGNKKLQDIYVALRKIRYAVGSMPSELLKFRADMDKTLKKELQKKVSNWQDVWGAL